MHLPIVSVIGFALAIWLFGRVSGFRRARKLFAESQAQMVAAEARMNKAAEALNRERAELPVA